MKRAILILAATGLLGAAGCGRRCNQESLTVNWTFLDAGGQPTTCEASGVTTIRVFLNGVAAADQFNNTDFTCAQVPNGIPLDLVPVGANALEVEAFDGSGGLIIQNQQTVQVHSCGDTAVALNLAALTGDATIHYVFSDRGPCTQPGSLIWYELLDHNGQVVDIVAQNNTPQAIPCDATQSFSLPQLPFGRYTVSRIEEVSPAPAFATLASTCTAQPLEHLIVNETVNIGITAPSAVACF